MAKLPEVLLSPEAAYQYADHPVDFVIDNILAPMAATSGQRIGMTGQQRDFLNAVRDHYRVGVESGHGTGKSACLSWLGIWFLCTRHNTLGQKVKVPCIAPTFHQLYDVLWPEFRSWLSQSRIYPMIEVKSDEIYIVGHKDGSFIRARSPQEPDNLQGFHAPHLLWICDEAFGITNQQSWEMIEGSLTQEDNRIVFGGQHTVVTGYCHDTFHSDKKNWSNLRFSSADSPLAKREFAERIERKYGKNSDVYRVRVLGAEPKGNPDAYIQLSQAEAARQRDVSPKGALRMGVDCARFGDDLTVVTVAQGLHVFPLEILAKSDTFEIYDLVVQAARKYRKVAGYQGTIECRIDTTGGYGAGVYDMLLRNTTDSILPISINFGGAGDDEYADIVSMMWGSLARQLGEISLPDDSFLIEELSTRRFTLDKNGRVQIEPKAKYKKDYEGSPDRSDSLVMCLFSKRWRKRVWEWFGRDMMVDMAVKWYNQKQQAHHLHYVGLHLSEDMKLSALCCLWDQSSGRLFVYDAWSQADANLTVMIPMLAVRCHMRDFRVDKFLGNDKIFEDGAKPVARQITQGFAKIALPEVRIRPAVKYDKFASVVDLGQMMRGKRVFVSKRLEDVAADIQGWVMDDDSPAKAEPYCELLCMVSGELKQRRELEKVLEKPIFRDYAKREIVEKVYTDMPIRSPGGVPKR